MHLLKGVTITSGSTYLGRRRQQQLPHRRPDQQGNGPDRKQRAARQSLRRRFDRQPLRWRHGQPQQRHFRIDARRPKHPGEQGQHDPGAGLITGLSNFTNGGTVNANVSGGTLSISAALTTNTGTLEAQKGATLNLNNTTLTNFASTGATAGTLSGGTYQVWSGTLSFNNQGFTNDVVTNAASILLDGTSGTPSFIDQLGNNAFAHFATNAAAGSFTIQNGVSVTSASSDFSNAGTLNIGANSTFTVGGGHDYNQSGGVTYLQSASSNLAANTVNINGGTLQGFGTVTGNLVNGGTVHPGDGPGILTVTGNYTQTSSGTLEIQIGGPNAGTGYSQLSITGTAALGGTLDVGLLDGFTPYNGETFTILTSAGLNSSTSPRSMGCMRGTSPSRSPTRPVM